MNLLIAKRPSLGSYVPVKRTFVQTPSTERFRKRMAADQSIAQVTQDNKSSDESGPSDSEEEVAEGNLEESSYDRFFKDLHMSKSSTSNNTLSQLPVMSQDEFSKHLMSRPKLHAREMSNLKTLYRNYFPQWRFELEQGFNVLCYGYGSKRELLLDFVQEYLGDGPVVVIHGYHPSIQLKKILVSNFNLVFYFSGCFRSRRTNGNIE